MSFVDQRLELDRMARWVSDTLLEVRSMRRALALKYSPDQPRVPAGSGRESGRWTDGNGEGSTSDAVASDTPRSSPDALRVAGDLLMLCVNEGYGTGGAGASVYTFGFFRCPNGASWRWERRGRWTVPPRIVIPWFQPSR
jgi:hypothetical protein